MNGVWERLLVQAALDDIPRENALRLLPNVTDADLDFIRSALDDDCPYQAWELASQLVTKWKAARSLSGRSS